MAEKKRTFPGSLSNTPSASKKGRKTVMDREETRRGYEQTRGATRINIGAAFQRWRQLKDVKKLGNDAEVAVFLLDRYEEQTLTSTPMHGHGFKKPPQPPMSTIFSESIRDEDFTIEDVQPLDESISEVTSIAQHQASLSLVEQEIDAIGEEEFNNIRNATIEWDDDDDDTWYPEPELEEPRVPETEFEEPWDPETDMDETWNPAMDTQSVSSLEEDHTKEMDTDDSDSDEDYRPPICVRTGGALKTTIRLDDLPILNAEELVHDLVDPDEPDDTDDATDDATDDPSTADKILTEEDAIGHSASITYHDSLIQLARYLVLPIEMCPAKDRNTKVQCRAPRPFEVNVKSRATAAIVEWRCPSGHLVWKWSSQRQFKHGMQVGDFLLSTNILLSGNNFAKISLLFNFMNMGMVSSSSFFRIQDYYCVDTVQKFWNDKRAGIITQLKSKGPVVVLGDGRMDSPGWNAQYCSYSAMCNETKQLISVVNIDKRETMRNSVIMEKEGFLQTFETLRQELDVAEVVTDAHSQISALFTTGIYKDSGVHHTLDIWHGAKNLGKKIQAAGQQKIYSVLLQWSRDICNHFWHCCKLANDYDEFYDMWSGLLYHVSGKHQWMLGACHHGPIEDSREKEYIPRNSAAHQRLSEIVLDQRWLNNVHKFLKFRSTAELESFHNHMLMYAAKRFAFTPPVYSARILLAALDYNHHVHRPVKRRADGSIQYHRIYKKRSRKWSLYALKVEKNYSYISELQSAIVREKLTDAQTRRRTGPYRPFDPRHRGTLSGDSGPSTMELLQAHISRVQEQPLPKQ